MVGRPIMDEYLKITLVFCILSNKYTLNIKIFVCLNFNLSVTFRGKRHFLSLLLFEIEVLYFFMKNVDLRYDFIGPSFCQTGYKRHIVYIFNYLYMKVSRFLLNHYIYLFLLLSFMTTKQLILSVCLFFLSVFHTFRS